MNILNPLAEANGKGYLFDVIFSYNFTFSF